jgi:hypothetical protein
MLGSVTQLIQDWFVFSEEKWRAISDSQLGWKPLRGRWTGWEEIFRDVFDESGNAALSSNLSPIQRRYENAIAKGSAASAVACFLNDLEALRQSLVAVTDDTADTTGNPYSQRTPRRRTTIKSPVIRNPKVVDADDDWDDVDDTYEDVELGRALVSRARARPTGTGKQAAITPPGPAVAVPRIVLPVPASADPQPPRRRFQFWRRDKR